MDPLTQGVLGAVAATALAAPPRLRLAAMFGALGGMAADADIVIRSASDPLLNIEYHRHFTHALVFIPVGGLICAAALWWFVRRRLSFPTAYGYSTAGYATAGLLDACTSYGTQLLWPFSGLRVAWNIISVVDPLFTLPLLILLLLATLKRRPAWARAAGVFSLLYLALGVVQRERASSVQEEIAATRGHDAITLATVKPSIGNLILWRSLYAHQGKFVVDAIRVGLSREPLIFPGREVPRFDVAAAVAALPADSVLANDLRRFAHFSDGYVAAWPDQEQFLTDLRYSPVPNGIDPLWGIDLAERGPNDHVGWTSGRTPRAEHRTAFLRMLRGDEASIDPAAADP